LGLPRLLGGQGPGFRIRSGRNQPQQKTKQEISVAKIGLVSFTSSHFAFGLRALETYLRHKGHEVTTVHAFNTSNNHNQFSLLTQWQLDKLGELFQGMDAVGVSLISVHSLHRTRQLCARLREVFPGRVILGGPPVIMTPALFLEFADYVCLGEGEECLHGFLTRDDLTRVPNLSWREADGTIRSTPLAPLIDVDAIPVPDLDLKDVHILSEDEHFLLADRPEFFRQQCLLRGYRVMLTRGCPFHCTYCCNNKFNALYKGLGKTVRKRGTELVLQEIERAKEAAPGLKEVYFLDDDLMSIPLEDFRAFMGSFAKRAGLDIWEFSSTFTSMSAEKMAVLHDLGIKVDHIRFGMQSASPRMNKEVYRRPFNKEMILEKLISCLEYGHKMYIDFILDNPYETLDDLAHNVAFFTELGRRIRSKGLTAAGITLNLFSLKFYPGTELYDRAMADGNIGPDYVDTVLQTSEYSELRFGSIHTYLTFIYYMAMYGRFGALCRLSSNKAFLSILRGLTRLPFAESLARAAAGLAVFIKRRAVT
jgi:radical SAM superfamily enzyme YgiQ (UPF0313 family)